MCQKKIEIGWPPEIKMGANIHPRDIPRHFSKIPKSTMAFCDYSKMNFKVIVGKNHMRHMDTTKTKLINQRVATRSTSPKKLSPHYRLVLDIVLTAVPPPYTIPIPVTPPPTRASTPEPTTTRTIIIYGQECDVTIPAEMDIYEGLRLNYPQLYKMVLDEEKELAYDTKISEDMYESHLSYVDYLEWAYD
jgi:hypothetical protein